MKDRSNIDPTLRALGNLGRYQMLQVFVITLRAFGAAYQLLGNIFIGRIVTWHQCSAPANVSEIPEQLQHVDWNSSQVTYSACEITVSTNNLTEDSQHYSCLFGYDYDFPRDKSFRTEFDLVCDRKLLGGLVQTLVIVGQGFGAVLTSMVSDRFGRKTVLVVSQLLLLTLGIAVGFAPSYPVLALFKFLSGFVQQGVVTSAVTIMLEWFSAERRSVSTLVGSTTWGVCTSSMALVAYLMQNYSWRYLQFAFSSVSLVVFFHMWYVDESLRWLVANGKKERAVKVLKRAARVNGKDLSTILKTLESTESEEENKACESQGKSRTSCPGRQSDTAGQDVNPVFTISTTELNGTTNTDNTEDANAGSPSPRQPTAFSTVEVTLDKKKSKKLTVLDIFRNKRLFQNALIMWTGWFTSAFAFFALYMMSTRLHGNRFLNYFLTSLMELLPGFFFYFAVDRLGRKMATRPLFALAGLGLLSSGIFRIFAEDSVLRILSVASAMLGMFGASGMFSGIFFFTPELFPTNMRNQALGVSSFVGRCGGMLSPFMTDLADIAVWAPGALIGSLCFFVVLVMHFLPETKGRELPNTVDDINLWHQERPGSETHTAEN